MIVHPAIPFVSSGGVATPPPYQIFDAAVWTDPSVTPVRAWSATYSGGNTFSIQSYDRHPVSDWMLSRVYANGSYPPDQPVYSERWLRGIDGDGTENSSVANDMGPWYTYIGAGGYGDADLWPAGQTNDVMLLRYLRTSTYPTNRSHWVTSGGTMSAEITWPYSHSWLGYPNAVYYHVTNDKYYTCMPQSADARIVDWGSGPNTTSVADVVALSGSAFNAFAVVGEDTSGQLYVHCRDNLEHSLKIYNSSLVLQTTITLGTNDPDGHAWEEESVAVCNEGAYFIVKRNGTATVKCWDISGGTLGSKVYEYTVASTGVSYMRRVNDTHVYHALTQELWRVA